MIRFVAKGADSGTYKMLRDKPDILAWGIYPMDDPEMPEGHLVELTTFTNIQTMSGINPTVRKGTVILDPEYHNRGIGRIVRRAVTPAVMSPKPALDVAVASIKDSNPASLKLCQHAGFVAIGKDSQYPKRTELWQVAPRLGAVVASDLINARADELGVSAPSVADINLGTALVQRILQ